MIFKETWQKVLTGQKSQTRRPVHPGEHTWICGHRDLHVDSRDTLLYSSIHWSDGRARYYVGQTHAVVPGRGKRTIWYWATDKTVMQSDLVHPPYDEKFYLDRKNARFSDSELRKLGYLPLRIKVLSLWREDVREISQEDAVAEGFENPLDFLATWTKLYDKRMSFVYRADLDRKDGPTYEYLSRKDAHYTDDLCLWSELKERPIDLYRAWAIEFCLVEV